MTSTRHSTHQGGPLSGPVVGKFEIHVDTKSHQFVRFSFQKILNVKLRYKILVHKILFEYTQNNELNWVHKALKN